ncbi:hypothetical protein [Streptomyces sp. enrichment culture]|uniref:hypothetical protein n=1 Tax=Streptomyces sp. enrichment culture TaxID=1795815 RepID=UPI003F54A068
MPELTTTERQLRDTLSQITQCRVDTIPGNRQPEQDLQNSLALAEFVTVLDPRLSVIIPDEETGRLRTNKDLRTLLAHRTASRTDAT